MQISVEDSAYKIVFWVMGNVHKITFCDIVCDGRMIVTGYATCHPNDNFCKETGRKLALGRALRALTDDREMRRKIWRSYFMTSKKRQKWLGRMGYDAPGS